MRHWAHTVVDDAFWLNNEPPAHVRDGLLRLAELASQSEYHVFRTAEMEALADELSETTTLSELSKLMWRLTVSVGFQNYAVFLLRQAPGKTYKTRICTSFKERWIARYQQQSYQFVDPVVADASAGDGYFQFSEISSKSPSAEIFWQDAERHGIGRNGLCFAMTHSSGMRLGISFCTIETPETVQEIVALNGFDLEVLCELVADCFSFVTVGPPLSDNILTTEEIRFLQILASSSDPEAALNASAQLGSISTLQSSIRMKLGIQSVYQAVAIAASSGWFNLLPYDQSEVERPFPVLSGLSALESYATDPALISTKTESVVGR